MPCGLCPAVHRIIHTGYRSLVPSRSVFACPPWIFSWSVALNLAAFDSAAAAVGVREKSGFSVLHCICYCIASALTSAAHCAVPNRLKDVQGCSAAPEEFSFTAFLALFLFAVPIVCVCVWVGVRVSSSTPGCKFSLRTHHPDPGPMCQFSPPPPLQVHGHASCTMHHPRGTCARLVYRALCCSSIFGDCCRFRCSPRRISCAGTRSASCS